MVIEYVLFFYMLGVGLVAYIFHEMDERSKDVPRTKVERNNKKELTIECQFLFIVYINVVILHLHK